MTDSPFSIEFRNSSRKARFLLDTVGGYGQKSGKLNESIHLRYAEEETHRKRMGHAVFLG